MRLSVYSKNSYNFFYRNSLLWIVANFSQYYNIFFRNYSFWYSILFWFIIISILFSFLSIFINLEYIFLSFQNLSRWSIKNYSSFPITSCFNPLFFSFYNLICNWDLKVNYLKYFSSTSLFLQNFKSKSFLISNWSI